MKEEFQQPRTSDVRTISNTIWFIFLGGFWSWLIWLIGSALAFVSIVGIPWGRACYNISELAAAPFGKEAINRRELTQRKDIGTSAFGTVGNLFWFVLCGFWLAAAHCIAGVLCCITIIGIPFGLQHFKLAGLAVAPIGKSIVTKELADEARKTNAKQDLQKLRSGAPVASLNDFSD
ncbi:YccF domain-containing protein [Burkholderia vietnamiensis]|uniref:YccF domain-containing protein n=1 Tax=Burkholderia vietnamiensis TaxID=60552 RepID=UPI001CF13A09|nr:YccF domain-containing protein [Burkholderia vietnamiensis]MCA8211622.1 YccF domain-containing protein [Burkholderia vietnamiensis]